MSKNIEWMLLASLLLCLAYLVVFDDREPSATVGTIGGGPVEDFERRSEPILIHLQQQRPRTTVHTVDVVRFAAAEANGSPLLTAHLNGRQLDPPPVAVFSGDHEIDVRPEVGRVCLCCGGFTICGSALEVHADNLHEGRRHRVPTRAAVDVANHRSTSSVEALSDDVENALRRIEDLEARLDEEVRPAQVAEVCAGDAIGGPHVSVTLGGEKVESATVIFANGISQIAGDIENGRLTLSFAGIKVYGLQFQVCARQLLVRPNVGRHSAVEAVRIRESA